MKLKMKPKKPNNNKNWLIRLIKQVGIIITNILTIKKDQK